MSKPKLKSIPLARSRRQRMLAITLLSGAFITTGAIASTQPFETDNPFAQNTPNPTGIGSGITEGAPTIEDFEPSLEDLIPNFPGLPGRRLPSSPDDIIETGLGGIFGNGDGPVPSIFKDVLSGNIDGILSSIFSILTSQNEIFEQISKVVLSDGWKQESEGEGESNAPPNPYEMRLPPEEGQERTKAESGEGSLITRSPIVLRRDRANQYDQELSRAMAAPMLAEAGQAWLNTQIATSADMMQTSLETTQSAIAKSAEATDATSTQEIVRRSAELSGISATMQMQEMQQNALISQSLWNMQQLESAQLQLAANTSEAADEQNRRDRASRASALYSSAAEGMMIPGLADISVTQVNTEDNDAPPAPALFAAP